MMLLLEAKQSMPWGAVSPLSEFYVFLAAVSGHPSTSRFVGIVRRPLSMVPEDNSG